MHYRLSHRQCNTWHCFWCTTWRQWPDRLVTHLQIIHIHFWNRDGWMDGWIDGRTDWLTNEWLHLFLLNACIESSWKYHLAYRLPYQTALWFTFSPHWCGYHYALLDAWSYSANVLDICNIRDQTRRRHFIGPVLKMVVSIGTAVTFDVIIFKNVLDM